MLHVFVHMYVVQVAPTVFPVHVSLAEAYNQGGSLCVAGSVPPEAMGRGARSMIRCAGVGRAVGGLVGAGRSVWRSEMRHTPAHTHTHTHTHTTQTHEL